MTDLNDTERRIVKMLEGMIESAERRLASRGWFRRIFPSFADQHQMDVRSAAIEMLTELHALNAIRTGQHKDERYD